MPFYNEATQELICKLVYWGPSLSGKTLNLQWLQQNAPPARCGKLAQLATETERTLFFEFLPLSLGTVGTVATRFHLYTVPGQASYQAGRRAILRGADGVVFVADARAERLAANAEALVDLQAGLASLQTSLQTLPHVFQCNAEKTAAAVAPAELCQALGVSQKQVVCAAASAGQGVAATLVAAATAVLAAYPCPVEP